MLNIWYGIETVMCDVLKCLWQYEDFKCVMKYTAKDGFPAAIITCFNPDGQDSPQSHHGTTKRIMSKYKETSSTYNRSWLTRSIMTCHSSLVPSKTGTLTISLLTHDVLHAFKARIISIDHHLPY